MQHRAILSRIGSGGRTSSCSPTVGLSSFLFPLTGARATIDQEFRMIVAVL
jgi:hypothetical protein